MANAALLVDWCTYPPVGHAIEGLQVGLAHHAAGGADVSVVLNRNSATELTSCCLWLAAAYTVELDVLGESLPNQAYQDVPAEWDWVVEEHRRHESGQVAAFPQLGRLADAAGRHFHHRRSDLPSSLPETPLRLELPASARAEAEMILHGAPLGLTVMLSGGGPRCRYPSEGSWALILGALREAWPEAVITLVGMSEHPKRPYSAVPRAEAARLGEAVGAIDGYDLDLLVQLAIVERSGLFLSPHTGFGFAALAVGTPWLTLSGGPWYEYFHNGTPFHSLLPDLSRFPAFQGMAGPALVSDNDASGEREPSMTRARVDEVVPDLIGAAAALLAGRWSYEECLAEYFPRLAKVLGASSGEIMSWNGIHRRYL